MKNTDTSKVAIVLISAAFFAALLTEPLSAAVQEPASLNADVEADAALARRFEAEARVLTVFDREGNVVTTVGKPAIYNDPVFSPDGTRLAVVKRDLGRDAVDVWVLDIATGEETRLTSNEPGEPAGTPVWSPDGRRIAYMSLRDGVFGVYRQPADGDGEEELLYQHPGGSIRLSDWSLDGRFLSFGTSGPFEETLYALPTSGDGLGTPIELLHTDDQVLIGSSFSADGRFLSYTSDLSGRLEVYVRPFDPAPAARALPVAGPWKVSEEGGRVLFSGWGRNGHEIYYVAPDGAVMAVETSTSPTFESGRPRLLFRLSEAVPVFIDLANVSRDGERIVIAVPNAPTLQQITVFDRQGRVVQTVGEPGRYSNPSLSPDGTRVAVQRRQTGPANIWSFDVASGRGAPINPDSSRQEETPLWSADGNDMVYASVRGIFDGIYRKAWNGTSDEEVLFQYTPGADMELADWSADGRYVTFHDGCWGVLYVVPVSGEQEPLEREAMEWLRDEYLVAQARFSPDSRFIAYLSDETEADTFQVYVGPFDAVLPDGGRGGSTPVQVSDAGALGMISWRQDGRELYYLTPDWEVMAVDVTTTPTFESTPPRLLFRLPGPLSGDPVRWRNISADGERFVFTIDVPVSPY